jgi:hypothetical protein
VSTIRPVSAHRPARPGATHRTPRRPLTHSAQQRRPHRSAASRRLPSPIARRCRRAATPPAASAPGRSCAGTGARTCGACVLRLALSVVRARERVLLASNRASMRGVARLLLGGRERRSAERRRRRRRGEERREELRETARLGADLPRPLEGRPSSAAEAAAPASAEHRQRASRAGRARRGCARTAAALAGGAGGYYSTRGGWAALASGAGPAWRRGRGKIYGVGEGGDLCGGAECEAISGAGRDGMGGVATFAMRRVVAERAALVSPVPTAAAPAHHNASAHACGCVSGAGWGRWERWEGSGGGDC